MTICAVKGCAVTGLPETERDGTSEIVGAGYLLYFSCDCSGVKIEMSNVELD